MSDTILVSPRHHTHDLHDVYASFMGYFERKGIAWYAFLLLVFSL